MLETTNEQKLTFPTDQGDLEMPDASDGRAHPGLSHLFGPPPEAIRIPLETVQPNPHNPRLELTDIEALADNIHEYGLMQPVTVRAISGEGEDERYELIAGHRRRLAFMRLRERYPLEAQWRTVPAVLKTAGSARAYLMLLSSQLHSVNFTAQEEANAIDRLAAEGLTQLQIGNALNHSEGWVSKRRRVYEDAVLSGPVQTGKLAPGVAEELIPVRNPARRQELATRAIEQGWNQKEARQAARGEGTGKTRMLVMRMVRELRPLLRELHPEDLSPTDIREMDELRLEIVSLAQRPKRGQKRPVLIPSMAAAEAAAGVRQHPREHAERGGRRLALKFRER